MDLKEIYDRFAENEIGPLEASGVCERILIKDTPSKSKAYQILEDVKKELDLNDDEFIGLVRWLQAPLVAE